jgi:hypothetical protein
MTLSGWLGRRDSVPLAMRPRIAAQRSFPADQARTRPKAE